MNQTDFILEHLPCGCIVFQADGVISYVNPALCEILGYNRDELPGVSIESLLTISSRIIYQTHLFPMLKLQGYANEVFLTLKTITGSPAPVIVSIKASREHDQVYYIGTLTTVREREKSEYEASLISRKTGSESDALAKLGNEFELKQQQLDSKLSQLYELSEQYIQIGKVLTHDMQEPIRKITFYFNALLSENKEKGLSGDSRKVSIINKSVTRLRKLTNALFDFVSLNSTNEAIISLNGEDLLREAELEVKQSLGINDFTIHISQVTKFFGKYEQIKRVFVELIKNSVQNRNPERPLIIKIHSIQIQSNTYQIHPDKYNYVDHIQLEFADNGIGFDGQFNSHIFNLSNKLNSNSDGVGMGLTLCKQIITQHNGYIRGSSNRGEGAIFTIVLPVTQAYQ